MQDLMRRMIACVGLSVTLFAALGRVADAQPLRNDPAAERKKFIPHRKHDPLPGRVIGILLTDGQPILSTEGRSGPKDQLCFSTGGASYRWVYSPTNNKATIQNLKVPIPDGKHILYPSLTMANPDSVKRWGIVSPYTLVEVEVNSGKGSPNISSFVATEMRVVEGTKEYPLKMTPLVTRMQKVHAAYQKQQSVVVDAAMKKTEAGALKGRKKTGPRTQSNLMYLTWLDESKQVRFFFHTTVTDGAYTFVQGGARPIRPFPLPVPKGKKIIPPPPRQRAALPPPPPPRFKVKIGVTFGVEYGVEYVVSGKGEIMRTRTLAMRSFHRELSPPPGAAPNRPLPLPVKPRR